MSGLRATATEISALWASELKKRLLSFYYTPTRSSFTKCKPWKYSLNLFKSDRLLDADWSKIWSRWSCYCFHKLLCLFYSKYNITQRTFSNTQANDQERKAHTRLNSLNVFWQKISVTTKTTLSFCVTNLHCLRSLQARSGPLSCSTEEPFVTAGARCFPVMYKSLCQTLSFTKYKTDNVQRSQYISYIQCIRHCLRMLLKINISYMTIKVKIHNSKYTACNVALGLMA